MKILIVFNHPAPYKVELFNLINQKCELTVIFERPTCSDRPKAFYMDNKYDFECIQFSKGAFGKENSFSLQLRNYIKNNHNKFDLIIMNGYSTISEIIAINYMIRNKIPYSIYVNGAKLHNNNIFKVILKKRLISNAKYYFAPDEQSQKVLAYYGADSSKCFIYPYSTIHADSILAKKPSFKEAIEIKKMYNLPETFFVAASTFSKRKNNTQLLEIFAKIPANLVLFGNGPEIKLYRKLMSEKHIDNVIIRDFLPKKELLKIISISKGFISLSKEDIYGHTINEALSVGVPVIASEYINSSHDLIKNNVNGFIVGLNDNNEIIDKISKLNDNMFDSCVEIVKKNTLEISADKHIEYFKEILK